MKLVKVSKVGDPQAPFLIVGEGATPFPGLFHFTLNPDILLLSVK